MAMVEITTERLLLRQLREDDLAALHRLRSREEVARWTTHGTDITLAQSQQMLDDLLLLVNMMRSYDTRESPIIILAITIPPSTELIGTIGTFRPREVGFALHPDYWGNGYATESVRVFCQRYLRLYPRQQLSGKVYPENEAGIKCLRRCGFTKANAEEANDQAYDRDEERETWLLRS